MTPREAAALAAGAIVRHAATLAAVAAGAEHDVDDLAAAAAEIASVALALVATPTDARLLASANDMLIGVASRAPAGQLDASAACRGMSQLLAAGLVAERADIIGSLGDDVADIAARSALTMMADGDDDALGVLAYLTR